MAGHNGGAGGVADAPVQPAEVCDLPDLGPSAVYRKAGSAVRFTRQEGKKMKQEINTQWIYPPAADREALFAVANWIS